MLTPGRSIFALPLKDTPPIVLAVSKTVELAALPDVLAALFGISAEAKSAPAVTKPLASYVILALVAPVIAAFAVT